MRIVIVAPPKAGNSWVKCLFSHIYGLVGLRGHQTPVGDDAASFKAWAEQGIFADNWIFHQHSLYTDELAHAIEAVPAHMVTIIRDPYDAIVSRYFFVQAQAGSQPEGSPAQARQPVHVAGKPIDDPETISYLDRAMGQYLGRANGWLRSGRSVVIRYEELHRDPLKELTGATDSIQPVSADRIEAAIAACQADNLRTQRGLRNRIRTATTGDWRNHLSEAHLAQFRSSHGDLIRAIGYEVQ